VRTLAAAAYAAVQDDQQASDGKPQNDRHHHALSHRVYPCYIGLAAKCLCTKSSSKVRQSSLPH
jgi:hypothetical protein